jgi:5-methylcytosine-specific restriction endonuclease McrA
MALLTCRTCNQAKPRTKEFWHSEKTAADGLRRDCKDCRNRYRARIYEGEAHGPEYRERKRQAAAAWYAENKERASETAKRRQSRPDFWDAKYQRLAKRRASDPEFAAWEVAYRKKHYRQNRSLYAERGKAWIAANPDKAAAINAARNANRRARVIQAEGRYTPADVFRILDAQNGQCYWCSTDIPGGKHTVDHYIPLNKGGTNWPDNLVIACRTCNCAKRDMMPDEFRRYLAEQA